MAPVHRARLRAPHLAAPAVVAAALVLTLAGTAQAAWVVEPSVEISTGYENNVRLSPRQDEDAVVSTAAAQARFRNVGERSEVAGLIGASYLNYANTDDDALDDEDAQYLSLLANRTGERIRYGIQADGRRSLILRRVAPIPGLLGSLEQDLEDLDEEAADADTSGDEPPAEDDIDVSGTSQQVRRTQVRAEPFVAYQLGPLTAVRLAYEYAERRFDADGEVEGLRDTSTHGVSLGLQRSLSPRTSLGFSLGAARFQADGLDGPDREVDNFDVSVGFDHRLSEQVTFGADVGASRSENDDTGVEDTHLTYGLRLSRDLLNSRLTAYAQRSSQPSAYGGVVAADRVSVRYQRSLSARLELGFDLYGYRTEQLGGGSSDRDERDYLGAEPRVTWRLSEAWNVGASYRFRWTDRNYDDDFAGTADSHFVSLFLRYQPMSRF